MTNLETVSNARWQDVVNFVLGTWLFISPWVLGFRDAGVIATSAWLFGIIIAGLALAAIRELGRVGCRSHRRLGVYLPMGARCGVRRAHPVELADRRGAARDPGALVVLTRARFGSRHVATLTHSRVAATLRRVCRRASAWP
jgi:hypothetical protein